jgi:hypothetical protein
MKRMPRWNRNAKLVVVSVIVSLSIVTGLIVRHLSLLTAKSITGIVVDGDTHQGIYQAVVQVEAGTQTYGYVTRESGNFIVYVPGDAPKRVRLSVIADGFETLDAIVEPPAKNLVLQLHRQKGTH